MRAGRHFAVGNFITLANRVALGIVSASQSAQCTLFEARARLRVFARHVFFQLKERYERSADHFLPAPQERPKIMAWYAYCIAERNAFPELARHRRPLPLSGVTGLLGYHTFLFPAA